MRVLSLRNGYAIEHDVCIPGTGANLTVFGETGNSVEHFGSRCGLHMISRLLETNLVVQEVPWNYPLKEAYVFT